MKLPGWLPKPGDLYIIESIGPILITRIQEAEKDPLSWGAGRWSVDYIGKEGTGKSYIDGGSYLTWRYLGGKDT